MTRRPPINTAARVMGFFLGVLAIALVAALLEYVYPKAETEPCVSLPYEPTDRGAQCVVVEP